MNPQSKTDWERIRREVAAQAPIATITDDLYDANNAAAVAQFWKGAKIVRRRGEGKRPRKQLTAIRFDPDVLTALRATGQGWQTRVNTVLREWMQARPVV